MLGLVSLTKYSNTPALDQYVNSSALVNNMLSLSIETFSSIPGVKNLLFVMSKQTSNLSTSLVCNTKNLPLVLSNLTPTYSNKVTHLFDIEMDAQFLFGQLNGFLGAHNSTVIHVNLDCNKSFFVLF